MHVVVRLAEVDSSGSRVCTINSMQQQFCISLLMVSLRVQLYVYAQYLYVRVAVQGLPKLLCSTSRCQCCKVGLKCTDVCSCNCAEDNGSCDNDADDDDHESSDDDDDHDDDDDESSDVDDDHDDDDDEEEEEEEEEEDGGDE